MQRVSRNLIYLWSQFSSAGRAIIFILMAVLFCFFVVAAFAYGLLAAIGIIGGTVLFFPAIIMIGYLRYSFSFSNYLYFWIAIAAALALGLILSAYNVPHPFGILAAITVVGWICIFIVLSTYNPPR